jgi:hypothetical protein
MKFYKPLFLFFILAMSFCKVFSQHKLFYDDTTKVWCIYNTIDGRITGDFISYHPNGKLKSKGNLINGYRDGLWIVWDSTGRKRMERYYRNPFEFDRITPPIPQNGAIPLLAENSYILKYNSDSIIEYAIIKSEDMEWHHKN